MGATILTLDERRDVTNRRGEAWRPPLFAPPGRRGCCAAAVRRFLDLQAGSIWRDLSDVLPRCRGVVLDVGCGAQPYRELIGPAAEYVGIDTDEAKAHFGYEMPDTLYFSGEGWPVANASADVVLCTETLEHVPDSAAFLSEMARVLKPGGMAVLTVPFAARWHFIPHDYWRFTPSSLKRLLAAAGFDKVSVYARGNALTVACYKAMAIILQPLFAADSRGAAHWLKRATGLLFSPLLVALAVVANLSLRGDGGDDCLGYTVLAARREGVPTDAPVQAPSGREQLTGH